MSPVTLLPRGPTLGTMPAAIGLALMTTEIRLAAALSRTLPVALPAIFHRHAVALLDLALLIELTVLVLRSAFLIFEYLLLETSRLTATPAGALFLGAAYTGGLGAGAGPAFAGATVLATVAATVTIVWAVQNFRSRPMAEPDHRLCLTYK